MHAFSSFFHHVRTVAVGSAVVGVTSARRARRIVNTVKVCALCAAVSAATVFADTIELLSGGPITGARVVEKTSAEVRFYVAGKDILYMVGRPQVSRIVYDNGAVEDFRGAPATPPPAPVPPPQPAYAPPQPEYAPPVAQQPQITPPPDSRASAATYSNSDAFSNDAAEEGRGGGGVRLGFRIALSSYALGSGSGEDGGPGGTYGYGASIEGSVSIPVTNTVAFKPGLYFTYGAPIIELRGSAYPTNTTGSEIKVALIESISVREFAIGIPLLMQAAITGNKKVFVEAGIDASIPFGTTMVFDRNTYRSNTYNYDRDTTYSVDIYDMRTSFDLGIVCGFGFNITERLALDIRNVTYLNSFLRIASVRYSRYCLGVNVLF